MRLSLFVDVKSIQVISDFNLERMKKIARWCSGTKISKTNPPGLPGVSKNLEDQTKDHFGKLER